MSYSEMTLVELARLIKDKAVSPVDVVKDSLRRIEESNSELCAYLDVYADEATALAKSAEASASAGFTVGPLHGVPIALKDNVWVAGRRSTAGSAVLGDWIPPHNSTVTERLLGAGAICLGKTNMHEFAWGGTSYNPHYGFVKNPWDTTKFAAGSSGGSGAAVGARTCFGAIGTDTGGSIRLPSAVNGIVGIRPTYGRVSNYGITPLAWTMDTAGPMTRSVADCATMLTVIAGADSKDAGAARVGVSDYMASCGNDVEGIRIGVIRDYSFEHIHIDIEDALHKAINVLKDLGASVREVAVEHLDMNMAAVLTVESAEPSAFHQRWLREDPSRYGSDVRELLEIGELFLATDYIHAQRYRKLLLDQFRDLFANKVDVLVTPTLPFVTPKVGQEAVTIIDGVEEPMLDAIMQFTGLPSLTGLPALSVPCGFDKTGMPIGMQLISDAFREDLLFLVASAYEGATDWSDRMPKLVKS